MICALQNRERSGKLSLEHIDLVSTTRGSQSDFSGQLQNQNEQKKHRDEKNALTNNTV